MNRDQFKQMATSIELAIDMGAHNEDDLRAAANFMLSLDKKLGDPPDDGEVVIGGSDIDASFTTFVTKTNRDYYLNKCAQLVAVCKRLNARIAELEAMLPLEMGGVSLTPAMRVDLNRLAELEKDARRQCGWLVEAARDDKPQRYRIMDDAGIDWTTDPSQAIRFARREDAEMFAAGDEDAWHIVEHMFADAAIDTQLAAEVNREQSRRS